MPEMRDKAIRLGVSKPPGVFAEPYFSFVLMLYPED